MSFLAAAIVVVAALIEVDGANGAAIGTTIVEVGVAIAGGVLLAHGRPHLRPRLAVVPKVALAGALGATPMLAGGLPVVIRLVLSTLIYAVVLLALRAYPAELDALIPVRLRRNG